MAKIITKKSQIPKSAQKKIKNFSKLTDNQAIYQYELNKLVKRAKGDYGHFLKGYYGSPEGRIYQKDIQKLRNLKRGVLRQGREQFEFDQRIDRLAAQQAKIDREIDRQLAQISEDEIYDYQPATPEPTYILDINDLIEKEKQYQSTQEYLKDTGQAIDPFTGEVLEAGAVADIIESAKQYLDNLMQEITDYENKAIVSNSSYRSGRTRTSRSRAWIEANVTRAGDKIRGEIDRIRSSDDNIKAFAKKFSSPDKLQQLSDAIGEFIAECYSVVDTSSAYSASEVFMLLHDSPMSLDDSMEFEDEE